MGELSVSLAYWYGLTTTEFILWVISQYYFVLLLNVFRLWPLRIFQSRPVSLGHPMTAFVLSCKQVLTFWHQDVPGSLGMFPAPALKSVISPWSPVAVGNPDLGLLHTWFCFCFSLESFPYLNKNINYITLNTQPNLSPPIRPCKGATVGGVLYSWARSYARLATCTLSFTPHSGAGITIPNLCGRKSKLRDKLSEQVTHHSCSRSVRDSSLRCPDVTCTLTSTL